jgi:hypothetical protein
MSVVQLLTSPDNTVLQQSPGARQRHADTYICAHQLLFFLDCSFDEMAVGSFHTSLAQPVAAEYEEPVKLWELQDLPNCASVTDTDENSAAALLPLPPPRRRRGQLPQQPLISAPSTELIDMTAEQPPPLSNEGMSTEELLDTSAEALLPSGITCSLTNVSQLQQPQLQQPQQQQQQQSDWCSDWSAQLQEVVDSVAQSNKRRSSGTSSSNSSTTAAATAALQHSSRKRKSSSASTSDSSSSSSGSSTEQSSDSSGESYYYSAPSTLSAVQHAAVSSSKRLCLDRTLQASAGHVYAVHPEQWHGKLWITKAELLQQCPLESVERVYTLTGS